MADETTMDNITELMKKKQMKYMKKTKKNIKSKQSHIINNWIKKKQSKKTAKRSKQKIT